ncbi:hypothetical protein BBP40_003115 [Aspergillus hancockii]|nr:hypothetical protein BBP40_003115 [Aspergillus hancockii]
MKRSSHNQAAPNARPSKRSRIALACDICRARKSRCDGIRPSCSACSRLGFECGYTTPGHTQNVIVQKEYFQALEDRVRSVEETLAALRREARMSSAPTPRVDIGRTHTLNRKVDHLRAVSRKWLALLNMVFAMVKISTMPSKQYAETHLVEAEVFYQRALALYGEEILSGESVDDVQFLILVDYYACPWEGRQRYQTTM